MITKLIVAFYKWENYSVKGGKKDFSFFFSSSKQTLEMKWFFALSFFSTSASNQTPP